MNDPAEKWELQCEDFKKLQKWAEKFDLKQNGIVMFIEHLESWHVLGYKIHASNIQTSG